MSSTEGERLRAFMQERMGGRYGWITELERRSGVQRATLYAWWGGKQSPDLDKLGQVAPTLGVERAELVAVMDGYDLSVARREAVAREVEAALEPIRGLARELGLLPAATTPGAVSPGAQESKARSAA